MSITKDPIFRSIMFSLVVVYLALVSQSVFAAKGGKPPSDPPPDPQPGHVVYADANGTMLGAAAVIF